MEPLMKLVPMLALSAVLALSQPAFADAKSEAYVESSANKVLSVLSDDKLTDDERAAKFSQFMHEFAHVPTIARRVLGSSGRSLSEADFQKYYKAFEEYAIAVYEVQLDQFRGESLRITGSTDVDNRRSQVKSLVKSGQTGKDIQVIWDVLLSQDGKTYRVRDVGLNLNGSVLWLAQDQQAQFESFLDRNNGDVDKLVARINKMTADLEARKRAGAGSTLGQNRGKQL
jgi:phospholipid transport system substrate-binding protein